MRDIIAFVKRVRLDRWAWVNAKLGLLVWGVYYLKQTPAGPVEQIGQTLNHLAAIITMGGILISLIGLFMATTEDHVQRMIGYRIEISGLILAICGPLTNMIAQLSAGSASYSRAALAYTIAAFMSARCIMVWRAVGRKR